MKKNLLRFLFIFFLISLVSFAVSPNFVFAQKELEVKYPEVEGFKPETTKTLLPDYVKYIFNFLIWASGLIALGALVYGGFKYLTSAGMPEKLKDAKEQIAAALLGILILFASYLILITINPQLVIFHLGPIPPPIPTLKPGVLVCKEKVYVKLAWQMIEKIKDPNTSIEDKRYWRDELGPIMNDLSKYCYNIEGGGDVRKEFDNKIKYAYFINVSTNENSWNYGAIFYEEKNFKGDFELKNDTRYGRWGQLVEATINNVNTSSIRPFIYVRHPEGEATIYEEIDFNFGGTAINKQSFSLSPGCFDTPFIPQSIEIKKDDVFVVLYKTVGSEKDSEVFIEPGNSNLNNNERIHEHLRCAWYSVFYSCIKSAVTAYCLEPAKLY